MRKPEQIDDAQAVCDDMASRARQNVEVIIERLNEQGYVFHTNDDARTPVSPHHAPGNRAEEVRAWLGTRFDGVPMTLLSWLRLVGDVWLVGTHPEWPASSSADPLVIELEGSMYPDHSIVTYFADEFHGYEEERAAGVTRLFRLPVAPDRLHKDNVSGGPPYGFVLPDACADGLFAAEVSMPFVSYLQWVFSRGGSRHKGVRRERSGEFAACSRLICCPCSDAPGAILYCWIRQPVTLSTYLSAAVIFAERPAGILRWLVRRPDERRPVAQACLVLDFTHVGGPPENPASVLAGSNPIGSVDPRHFRSRTTEAGPNENGNFLTAITSSLTQVQGSRRRGRS